MDKIFIDEQQLDLQLTVHDNEQLRIWVINLDVEAQHHIHVDIEGANAQVQLFALCCQGSLHTNIRHLVGKSSSYQLVKFVVGEQQVGNYCGELYIAKDAQKTDAQQTNRNLLLSPTAKMNTKPQLEIYADDVKASHGASTGQLDTTALFYMQQRCIDPVTARQLLIAAFMNEVLTNLPDEQLREQLLQRIEQR